MTTATPAAWYPDPMGRHEFRWYDGAQWTEHVSSHGRQAVDSLDTSAKQVIGSTNPSSVQKQIQKHESKAAKYGGESQPMEAPVSSDLLDQRLVVINQKMKLVEVNTEFAIYNADGAQIGAVRQVGQNTFKKVIRFLGTIDQYFTHKYQVVDHTGTPVMTLTRPAKFFKSKVIISDALGDEVGRLVQRNIFGKIRFGMESGGKSIGELSAQNWRAWNFVISDSSGLEVARITKTFEGVLKTMFTTADNYVLEVQRPLEDPLRTVTMASALVVDVALKQDHRGFSFANLFDF